MSSTTEPHGAPNVWTPTERIAFRFATSYWLLVLFVWFPGRQLDFAGTESQATLAMPVLAGVVALVWSSFAKRTEYARGHEVLRACLRYGLALWMLIYGVVKFTGTQFGFPSSEELVTPYGSGSPFGLLAVFMGYSYAYSAFAGLGEVVGGLLLLSRRTTTLGALLLIAVLSNVIVLNFAYQWPVGYLAIEFLLMAACLVVPDVRRLADALFFHRAVAAVVLTPPRWNTGRKRTARLVFRGTAYAFAIALPLAIEFVGKRYFVPSPSPLDGAYDVERFVRNDQAILPLETDSTRWRRVIVADRKYASVLTMNRVLRAYSTETDTARRRIVFTWLPDQRRGTRPDSSVQLALAYERTADRVQLRGRILGDSVDVTLRRLDETKVPLARRGFHWITEQAVNR